MRRKLAGKLAAVIVGVGLLASAANAAVYGWDFDVDPDDPSNAVPMTRIGDGYGQGGGHGVFVDDGGANGFVIGGWTGGFTLDMRVRVMASAGIGRRSFSFRQANGDGRGVALRTDGINVVSGAGVIGSYGIDLSQFQTIRHSLSNNGTVVSYLWVSDAGLWAYMGNSTLGGSGASSLIPPGGIGLGSLAPGNPGGRFVLDWVYVDDAMARGQMPPPLKDVPEPASLALLALGLIPAMHRRRS